MEQRRNITRDMYYVDGSTVRKRDIYYSAAPAYTPGRRPSGYPERRYSQMPARGPQRRVADPERRVERRPVKNNKPVTYRKSAIKARNSLAFDFKYTFFLALAMIIMIASCANMIRMQSEIDDRKSKIASLQSEIREVKADNEAFENSLSNTYTLDEIRDIAVNELGMVYSEKGQIVYYDATSEDYVNQYRNVPGDD
ncbi:MULTISPECIES: hypothetical protein [Eubacterium]|uniref:Cell division protein FtsL n=1 Tax=Eubacterium ruminantium TaxID=42322 RepID=A0A1T4NV98_9FIRM|nr:MULTISPECIES: hypothetical protein [Eubacterium]MCR5368004.1 hypothetical protein [Eubacterium sp.]SCW55951.1 hypothetical protein SAMN05660484_01721 [Eubacterium ruminantium]SDN04280.1 hypothetical protein SAMN04490370_10933 [Eubacterium ruminantium]SJZ83209.1 hypothetical protein SAMN02745110_01722 [Eubacterium ruminantium]